MRVLNRSKAQVFEGRPIAVLAQVHYPEIWQGISMILARRMSVPFDLIVATSHDAAEIAQPSTPLLRSFRVLSVENRGRDVLPFLRSLAVAEDFEIGLKIHTKKSPQRADGARWLSELLESLLPSPRGIRALVGKIAADKRIGFVAPHGFCLPVRPWILQNGDAMTAVMASVGHELTSGDLDDAYFAAGNMFWFRRDALTALAADSLSDLFEVEAAQLDGTIAHAVERVFPVEARRQGFLTVAMPALLASTAHRSDRDILEMTRLHTEEPNFLFPSPYQSPASAAFKLPLRERLLQFLMRFATRVPQPVRRLVGQLVRSTVRIGARQRS